MPPNAVDPIALFPKAELFVAPKKLELTCPPKPELDWVPKALFPAAVPPNALFVLPNALVVFPNALLLVSPNALQPKFWDEKLGVPKGATALVPPKLLLNALLAARFPNADDAVLPPKALFPAYVFAPKALVVVKVFPNAELVAPNGFALETPKRCEALVDPKPAKFEPKSALLPPTTNTFLPNAAADGRAQIKFDTDLHKSTGSRFRILLSSIQRLLDIQITCNLRYLLKPLSISRHISKWPFTAAT
jgi:hypothetical protein